MSNTRVASIDVGNDSIKAIFGELEYELNIPNIMASRCGRPSCYRN